MKALLIAVSLATLSTAGVAYAAGTDQVLTSTGNSLSAAHWMPDNGPSLTTAQVKDQLKAAIASGEVDGLNTTLYKGA